VPAKIIDLRPAAKPKARKERQTRAPRIVPDDLSEERPVQTRINTEVVDPIKRYLIEIGRYPLIDKEEEQRLSKLVRAGLEARDKLGGKVEWASGDTERGLNRVAQIGKNAKTDFMQANLRLVVSIAKRYRARAGTLDFLDLIQEGNLGLEHAIDKFDGERGFKFSTYSTNWIRQSIVRGIANTATPIRIPVHEHDVLKRLGVAEEEVKSQGLQLTGAEFDRQVAATMEIPLKRLKQIRTERQTQNPASLNKTVNEDGDAELQDLIVDNISASQLDEALTDISYDGDIKEMFALLNKMEALIIASRYGLIGGLEPMTLEQVSEHLIAVERQENPNSIIPVTAGVTRERVRQIESIATMKMSRFRVFPELVKQLGLDPEQKKRFEVYFMAAPIYHGPEARYQRSGVKSGDMHRIIARNVWSILDEKFGKNRMEFVIKSVLDDNAITHSGTRDIPSGKVYTDLMVRLGVSPLQKYQTTQKLQHDFLSKASHKLETEVLRRLLGMPDY
jgi:RNA polymerase primary sigma factor